MPSLIKFVLLAAAALTAFVALLALAQTALIFPRWAMVGTAPALPPEARRLTVRAETGETLIGIDLPAIDPLPEAPVILGFGGNAWPAEALALYLRQALPGHRVVVFHYRGYGPSEGRPSAHALLGDAFAVHDSLAADGAGSVVALGLSIGAGPAAHLAAGRDLAGVILVTPFDSLTELARSHYPWAPVRWLLRHRMDVAGDLAQVRAPVALIAAGRDTIVPAARTAPLRGAARNLVLDAVIDSAGHNDLYDHPDFLAALREAVGRITAATGRPDH